MLSFIQFPTAKIPNANDDPVLHDIVKKCMIYGPCGTDNPSSPYGTSSKRILHQVYELLLIEMESAYSYSAALPRNARYIKVYELLLIEMELIHRNLKFLTKNLIVKFNQITELIIEWFIDNFHYLSISQIILEVIFVPFTRKP